MTALAFTITIGLPTLGTVLKVLGGSLVGAFVVLCLLGRLIQPPFR